ncbi:MAG: diacylglycerol/lipid kinase family protein, partial [Eubacteriales bacterium]
MKKLLLIINPVTAKSAITPHLIDVVDTFERGGYTVNIHISQYKNDTCEITEQHGSEYDTIVCVGGDGTLNETVSGVMKLEKKPCVGYIPAGTTNDFAGSWGIPQKPLDAAKSIVSTEPSSTDVSLFCGKPFVYVAAFGVFTEASYQTPQQLKQSLGRTAYILEGIKSLSSIKPWKISIEHDEGSVEGEFLYGMISNTRRVGGFELKMKDDISISDGLMELILIRNPANHFDNAKMLNAVLAQDTSSEYITFVHTKNIRFHTDEELP